MAFTMQAQVGAGVAAGYATTLPAGQVGLISFGSSNNSFDDFKVRDLAGPYEVDGRWFAEVGDVQVDSGGYPDVLSINSTVNQPVPVVRRGFRAETFVMTFKFYWSTPCKPGAVFGYLDPSNWWAVYIDSSDGKARLIQRADDGPVTTIATDTTVLSLTNNNWYTAKLVVEYQTGFPFANVACLWVDTDNDADFSDETTLLGAAVTGAVGYCGVFRHNEGTNVAQYDDVKLIQQRLRRLQGPRSGRGVRGRWPLLRRGGRTCRSIRAATPMCSASTLSPGRCRSSAGASGPRVRDDVQVQVGDALQAGARFRGVVDLARTRRSHNVTSNSKPPT